ncbi:MAG: cytochrome c oxidase subunit 3 [Alphaproteobacteria bacterium]|nr:cytochrome c oxidase subunit 3 [Alphaproteobacteria bacterium]
MIFVGLFLTAIAAIVVWFLSGQRLAAKPWLEQGVIGDVERASAPRPAKLGLGVFLAVVGTLFALLMSAYAMRINAAEWWPRSTLTQLWLNTGLLLASSVALQWSVFAVRRDWIESAMFGLFAAGVFALCFLAGQLWVWRELHDAGLFLAASPAVAFLYLISGLHGLHLAGGMVALGRTVDKAGRELDAEKLRPSIELCAIYWHFLLAVWFLAFAVLSGWGNEFVVICRGLVS